MNASDLIHVNSTHELLFALLQSELGLLSVMPPASQILALRERCNPLRQKISEGVQPQVKTFTIGVPEKFGLNGVEFNYAQDALLFKAVFSVFNATQEEHILPKLVYPAITFLVQGNKKLSDLVCAAVLQHAKAHKEEVGQRMLSTLTEFRLHEIAAYLRTAMDTARASRC